MSSWFSLAALGISLGTTIYAWLTSRSRINSEHLKSVDLSIAALKDGQKTLEADLKRSHQALEAELKHLPNRDAAHDLELAIQKLNGRLDTLDERLKPVAAISERMQELYLEQAKKR